MCDSEESNHTTEKLSIDQPLTRDLHVSEFYAQYKMHFFKFRTSFRRDRYCDRPLISGCCREPTPSPPSPQPELHRTVHCATLDAHRYDRRFTVSLLAVQAFCLKFTPAFHLSPILLLLTSSFTAFAILSPSASKIVFVFAYFMQPWSSPHTLPISFHSTLRSLTVPPFNSGTR